jgi:SAM-dependent methyltransferase
MYYEQEESAQLFTYVDSDNPETSDRQSLLTLPKAQFIHESSLSSDQEEDYSGAWVDIGGGIGDLLVAAQQFGYEVVSIEPDPRQAKVARARGISVIEDYFTHESGNVETLARAKVVSLINVLEHIPAPRQFLENLASQMRSGAILAVEVPRHPSLSSILQLANVIETNRHINPPEHLHVFSDLSLLRLFEDVGLKMENRWLFGSDALEVFFSVGAHLGWEAGFDSNGLPDTINRLQSSVDQRALSDNMLVIGRKK